MPVLARLRLGSIGCENARFDPLDIELVGADRRLRHTLLALANGGGKSSLIGLVLLLLHPKVGLTLGKTSKGEPKRETDYVRRGETGIVLAEWLPDRPTPGRPVVLVTFLALERGEREGTAEKGFVAATLPEGTDAAEVFGLEQLHMGRLRGMNRERGTRAPSIEAILRRAREVGRAHGDWEVSAIAGHEPKRWLEQLRSFGLEPELARLLARMNLEEGDLAKALTFSSADEFVAQASRLLAPPEELVRDLHRAAQAWTRDFQGQSEKLLARDELRRLRPAWAGLVEKRAAKKAAFEKLKERAHDAFALLEGVSQAVAPLEATRDQALQGAQDARVALETARREVQALDGVEAAARLARAQLYLGDSQRRETETASGVERAGLEARVACAAIPALRLREIDGRERALRQELATRTSDVAPKAARRDGLALGLAQLEEIRTRALVDEGRAAASEEKLAHERVREANAALESSVREEENARRALVDFRRELERARAELARLQREGCLESAESLAAGHERLARAESDLEQSVRALEQVRQTARADAAAAKARSGELAARVETLGRAKVVAEAALARARAACSELERRVREARPSVANGAHSDTVGAFALPADESRVLDAVARASREAVTAQADSAARLAALEETCRSLLERNVLPPTLDQKRVLARAAGELEPGLSYVSSNLGTEAGDVLRSIPALGSGLVASSEAGLERAGEALRALELDVDVPVPVFLAADLTPEALAAAVRSPAIAPRVIVGVAPHVSQEARDALLERRSAERDRVRRLHDEGAARSALLETLARDLGDGLARFGGRAQRELDERDRALGAELTATATAKSAAESAARDGLARADKAARDHETARASLKRARESRQRVARALDVHAETLDVALTRVPELETRDHAARERVTSSRAARTEAETHCSAVRERRHRLETEARDATARAQALRDQARDPGASPTAIAPEVVAAALAELEALEAELRGGERALEDRFHSLRLERERVQKDLARESGSPDVAARARESLPSDATETALATAAHDARRRLDSLQQQLAVVRHQVQELGRETAASERAIARLEGDALTAARAWTAPEGGLVPVETVLASIPEQRSAVTVRVAHADAAVLAADRASQTAVALVERYSRLAGDVREGWEELRVEVLSDEIERAIVKLVRGDRNALVVLDAAGQLATIEKDARAIRKDLQGQRRLLAHAESEELAAAQSARLQAEASTSECVKRFASVRVPGAADTGSNESARAVDRGLAERAEVDLRHMDQELEDIEAQLADLLKTRRTLAEQLAQTTHQLAARLRQLQTASVLPPGLDKWSGQQFLRLELPLVQDQGELVALLEVRLEAWAKADSLPTARDLLPEALSAGLHGPANVLMPKADRFDKFHRRPIQQLSKDSGGEALTAAFILFCVLARVAAGSGRGERRVALALIDNPLGVANRFDFVDAQCRVAAAFGVQYIAASGITDPAATERFERLVTLTNPSQERVRVSDAKDLELGRPIEAVLLARDSVLAAPGAEGRAWSDTEARA